MRVRAVSGDGCFAVGSFLECDDEVPPCYVMPGAYRGLRWDVDTDEVVEFAAAYLGYPTDCSEDCATIAGDGPGVGNRWTAEEGWRDVAIGSLISFQAEAVSAAGDVLVGWEVQNGDGHLPARWTANGGGFALDIREGEARGVSADGAISVGVVLGQPVRWVVGDVTQPLGTLDPQGVYPWGEANAISADGSVVVGSSTTGDLATHAFRWTETVGMEDLGAIEDSPNHDSEALSVSRDGRLIVGAASTHLDLDGGAEAWIWDASRGMRSLKSVLETERGSDLTGWELQQANDVSFDGRVVVGNALDPSGEYRPFVAYVPEPAAASAQGAAAGALLVTLAFRARLCRNRTVPSRDISKRHPLPRRG